LRISDWSSDVCSADLAAARAQREKLAGDFEARVSAIVGTVAGAADTPTKNAEVMSGEIGGVSERAQSSAEAAQQATHNTQAVAAAAEQLAASVDEIRRQVTDCRVASQAVAGEVCKAANPEIGRESWRDRGGQRGWMTGA